MNSNENENKNKNKKNKLMQNGKLNIFWGQNRRKVPIYIWHLMDEGQPDQLPLTQGAAEAS